MTHGCSFFSTVLKADCKRGDAGSGTRDEITKAEV